MTIIEILTEYQQYLKISAIEEAMDLPKTTLVRAIARQEIPEKYRKDIEFWWSGFAKILASFDGETGQNAKILAKTGGRKVKNAKILAQSKDLKLKNAKILAQSKDLKLKNAKNLAEEIHINPILLPKSHRSGDKRTDYLRELAKRKGLNK